MRTKKTIEEKLSYKFIRVLKKRAYRFLPASNEAEGDYGDWEDWRKALVEFEKECKKERKKIKRKNEN